MHGAKKAAAHPQGGGKKKKDSVQAARGGARPWGKRKERDLYESIPEKTGSAAYAENGRPTAERGGPSEIRMPSQTGQNPA